MGNTNMSAIGLDLSSIFNFGKNVIMGALHLDNVDVIENCVQGTTGSMAAFEKELSATLPLLLSEKPSLSDIASAFMHMGEGFKDLGDVAIECEADLKDSEEMKLFFEMTDIFKKTSAKDIAMQTGKNLFSS